MTERPLRLWEGEDLVVRLGPAAVNLPVPVILDFDDEGAVLGIEILGLVASDERFGIQPRQRLSAPRVTFDREADAVYVRFAHGRSVRQEKRMATVALDSSHRLSGVRVRPI